MASPRTQHPSKEAWEAKKNVIREMYLFENRTCAQVREYLEKHHFHVNTRQIKNRLNEWNFESKKTRAEHYLAMLRVANVYAAEGYDLVFDVPKREDREIYTTRKIRKECDRIRKKRDRDRPLPEPKTLEEAEKILSDANINWRETVGQSSSRRSSHQPSCISHGPSPQSTTMHSTPAFKSEDMSSLERLSQEPSTAQSETSVAGSATDQPTLSQPGRFARQRFSHRQHKMNASKWVEPYYSQYFGTSVSKEAFERQRRRAMRMLESILKQDNQYIFPTLAEMVMIFGSNERTAGLVEFLTDSCAVIGACPGMRGSFTYDAPFRYVLAYTDNNADLMKEYGTHLRRSMMEIRQIWGEEHPNFLVNANFCAWHWILNQDYHLAIPLLRHCLPICERVMGLSSLVTINCLVIASRAHGEIQNHVWAKTCLETAMSRLDHRRKDLGQFRLVVMLRLGELNLKIGDYHTTEMQFWKVLQERTKICGLDAEATWSAAQHLHDLFVTTGREDHAEELMEYLKARLDWIHNRGWDVENGGRGQPIPSPPWWWPYDTNDDLTQVCRSDCCANGYFT